MPVSSTVSISAKNKESKPSVTSPKRLRLLLLLGHCKVFYDTGFRIPKVSVSGARS